MENQAFLRTLGCLDLEGIDGIPRGGMQLRNGSQGDVVNISCGTGTYVCDHGPSFSISKGFFAPGAEAGFYPYAPQHLENALANGASGRSVEMFAPEQFPVKTAIAHSFGVFNKLYTAAPTSSWPNHMFAQTGTSCGCTSTGHTYDQGGGPTQMFPQFTIYDALALDNVSFHLFANSSCGLPQDPKHRQDCTNISHMGGILDTYMAGVVRHVDQFRSQQAFWDQAASGTLPAFSYFAPTWQGSDHPCAAHSCWILMAI